MKINTLQLILGPVALILLLVAAGVGGEESTKGKPVILISIDSLRQDHLGCFGYNRETTPVIDRFAREDAVLFESAYAQAPDAFASHMSMLTGLYPDTHGMIQAVEATDFEPAPALASRITTLAEAFSMAGFRTAAFTDNRELEGDYGFGHGFHTYFAGHHPIREKNGFAKIMDPLCNYIEDHAGEDFFVFVQSDDTQAPFACPEPFRSRFCDNAPGRMLPDVSLEQAAMLGCHDKLDLSTYTDVREIVDAYDGCIAYADHALGRIFQTLKKEGLWDEATIVLTSGHGFMFMEDGLAIGHGASLTNEAMRIPLLMKLPEGMAPNSGRVVEHVVESVDIMPTLLALHGISTPEEVQGQDLVAGLMDGDWAKDHAFGMSPATGGNHCLVMNDLKFIEATRGREGCFIQTRISPMCPPFSNRPAAPYRMAVDQPYYYDFHSDPLGLNELLNRGDRAYCMRSSRFEYDAEPVRSPHLLRQCKETVALIAKQSELLGRRLKGEMDAGNESVPSEVSGICETGSDAAAVCTSDGASMTNPPATCELCEDSPVTDRSLLIRGDGFLWNFRRYSENRESAPSLRDLQTEADDARACYEAFKVQYPDRSDMVDWRIRSLFNAMEKLGFSVLHADKWTFGTRIKGASSSG